ncbi:uncharacterized protein LOC131158238 [Malania oleifera]|uniref:uncharacterized protein LOC131158238 n=1 Tax=Malania oleifera TaxID=397392 RepID=UPI0025AEC1C3|nr:uncharacterized protein LOC131158238 [Malania oleifera]
MLILHLYASPLQPPSALRFDISRLCPPFSAAVASTKIHVRPHTSPFAAKANPTQRTKPQNLKTEIEDDEEEDEDEIEDEKDDEKYEHEDEDGGKVEDDVSSSRVYRGRPGEKKDYDRDPEIAEIMDSCIKDPQKGRSKVEERLRKKRPKIVHSKTGSSTPLKVTFNKFDFSDSYIWLEFCNIPLEKDISLICDAIRAWFVVGRLGGCNSMNMQLSQAPLDQRPSYDAIQGANLEPTTFYNIGDLEVQDNLARVWVDIGVTEPLLLDVLVNALTQISSDHVGIKQLVFGGSEFESWKENWTSEDSGCSIHKI